MKTSFKILLSTLLCAALFTDTALAISIVDSAHNLSATGPGTVRAESEDQVCIFCHTPHGASAAAPLWNRYSSGAVYTPYNSSTAKASIGQPTGASKLCLSCHDGTVALGMVRSEPSAIPFAGGVVNMPPGRSNLGTDLGNDHPVSFVYDTSLATQNGELNDPSTLDPAVQLDPGGMMQCTACHDPHDDQFGQFLVKDNTASALCLVCHDKPPWIGSAHRNSTATWNGQAPDPWPNSTETTVEANACGSCHTPHDAGSGQRLLRFAVEEQNCYTCHNGNVAGTNIEAEFSKASVHPVATTLGIHDPVEDLVNPPRHVECADCHNPHAAKNQAASAPAASGALAEVAGIGSSGTPVDPLLNQYELCYRCHADSLDRGASHIIRQFPQTNTRMEFAAASASYHPVETIGRNPDVPSLINPLTTSSMIYCTDCHNNNQGPNAGGSGPDGPHGSLYTPLLERNLVLTDFNAESAANYALCYKCHDRNSILNDESFSEHDKHIRGEDIACTTCHDPHGVQGTTHLINFNLDYVTPVNGKIEFVDEGRFKGNCTLRCHGERHRAENYKP